MKYKLERIEIFERRIIRKIMGAIHTADDWEKGSNKEIYENIEKISEEVAKRRLIFFGHLYRMNENNNNILQH